MVDVDMTLDFPTILSARERIQPHIHRTLVLTSSRLDEASGASLFFKCENFQKIGAFKARGATNAVFSLDDATAQSRCGDAFVGKPWSCGGASGEASRYSRPHRHAVELGEGEDSRSRKLRSARCVLRAHGRGARNRMRGCDRQDRRNADSLFRKSRRHSGAGDSGRWNYWKTFPISIL